MSGSSAQFCTYHVESEPGVVEGVDSSIAVRSMWLRKCIGTAVPPEPYIPRGRVAANAYADPLYICVALTFLKLRKDARCINLANQPQEANHHSMRSGRVLIATFCEGCCITKPC